MAKKALVDSIIKLYSKLGGNISDVLGSRTNISFLGTGKSPEGFIDSTINVDAIGALGKSKVLDELKSSMGYLTSDKLNDIQAGKLYENMLKIDEVFNPKQIANITDLGSGTGNLTPGGLEYLRLTGRAGKKVGEDVAPPKKGVFDINTNKQVYYDDIDLPPPGSRGGADDIAAPFASAEDTMMELNKAVAIANAKGAGTPAKRATAREFLVEALKEDDTFATKLGSVVDAQDVKYITEGGGGIMGDPLVLVEKYFGPRILEMIPPGASNEEIMIFTKRIMNNVEDAAGLKPDNPRFDRFTARFVDEVQDFAKGGLAKILEV